MSEESFVACVLADVDGGWMQSGKVAGGNFVELYSFERGWLSRWEGCWVSTATGIGDWWIGMKCVWSIVSVMI